MRGLWLAAVLCVCSPVFASEEGNELFESIQTVVEALDPVVDYGLFFNSVDIGNAEGFLGLSGALYKYKKDDLELASARLGVALESNHKAYGTIQANMINIVAVYAPQGVKDFLSPGPMDKVWSAIEQYTKVGIGPGFDFEAEQIGMVATIGGRIGF